MYISCPSDKAFNEKYVPLKVRQEIEKQLKAEKSEIEEEKKIEKWGNLEDIKKLKELLDMGAITQEEYDAQKKKILA